MTSTKPSPPAKQMGLLVRFCIVLIWHSTVTHKVARLSKGLLLEDSQDAVDLVKWRAR
ncbi:hypothetical protein CY34DRAFT_809329 [Suillus luteus UH-Slu-Lm8-n1]|uniref:Uncharacterized protein n=1 Tax=Suillus luteus UH-Slu-Lm8-n1 TaxID=930992 RepID=A0A0D0AJY5_9AGAM|nr:hypothetical protein CY34DRAFT_809329 [Suillus luteus UH-Slu-Lm8-n1]